MTAAAIIRQAAAEGVRLTLTAVGTIRAIGNGDAVERWVPIIRQHKPDIVAELSANDVGHDALADPIAEARRQRVLEMLAQRPGIQYAMVTDSEADPDAVILALAIRGQATCELRIPRDRYDGALLLDLIERHGGTIH